MSVGQRVVEQQPGCLVEEVGRVAAAVAQRAVAEQLPDRARRVPRGERATRQRFQVRRNALDQFVAELPELVRREVESCAAFGHADVENGYGVWGTGYG